MKSRNIALLTAAALTSSLSIAEIEVDISGQMIFEASKFLEHDDGMVENHNNVAGDDKQTFKEHGKDWFKNSVDLRVYVDADIDDIIEGATFHAELNGYVNPLGSGADNGNNYNNAYTQRDILREAYVDSEYGDWTYRAGKQQVVWGTADGMKLLDMINPTDYTEMAQNQMEDSRIPVWMISAEKTLGNDTDLTMVISEPRENIFAGLNRGIDTSVRGNQRRISDWSGSGLPVTYADNIAKSHDYGQFTLMRGPTSITGGYDGFLNIVPDMGTVAALFGEAFSPEDNSPFTMNADGTMSKSAYNIGGMNHAAFDKISVDDFLDISQSQNGANTFEWLNTELAGEGYNMDESTFRQWIENTGMDWKNDDGTPGNDDGTPGPGQKKWIGDDALDKFFVNGTGQNMSFASNLFNRSTVEKDSAFEYMGNTTFRTFDAFANVKSQYKENMADSDAVDFHIRNKGIADNGMNWQIAYGYGHDRNPIIDLSWKNNAGEYLDVHYDDVILNNGTKTKTLSLYLDKNNNGVKDLGDEAYGGAAQTAAVAALGANATDQQKQAAIDSRAGILEFDAKTTRMHSLGVAADQTIETGDTLGTMVLRGEALYQKGTHQPTVHFTDLGYGDIVETLEMREIDRFKFVIGFDFTFLTNMFSSLQVIRDINLDSKYCAPGTAGTAGNDVCDADFATMMLTNGFNTDGAVKYKEYYSLYFSKPFGLSGEHRWNNMTMYEGGDGWWNWFTVGFGMTDNVEATLEINHYWGNPNTAFGQHQKSNNIQVGFKYNF